MPDWDIKRFRPRSGRALKEDSTYINTADLVSNTANGFNEIAVAQKTPQLALNNNLPLSSFRDKIAGNVVKDGPEYRVRSDADNNTSILRTALRGNYISGNELTPGLGLRIPTAPTGDQFIEWGYYDYNGTNSPVDGISFKHTSSTIFLNLYNDGVNIINSGSGVPQSEWNIDPLDGTGPSRIDINTGDGYVYRIPFIYYGYGPVTFMIGFTDKNGRWSVHPIHQADIDAQTSMNEPNLPLSVTSYNGGDSSTLDVYVGGRQISVSGPDKGLDPRIVGWDVENITVGETLTPILTFQHKTGRENIRVRLKDFLFESDKDIYLYLYRNHTLSAGTTTFTTPTGYDSNETATEWNREATAFTGGERFGGTKYVAVGSGGNASGANAGDLPESVLIEGENWGIVGRTKTGAGDATVSGFANIEEEW